MVSVRTLLPSWRNSILSTLQSCLNNACYLLVGVVLDEEYSLNLSRLILCWTPVPLIDMVYRVDHQNKRVWLEKELDCAHLLVLNNGAPISWTNSIMSVYDEDTCTLSSEMKFAEAIGVPLFNGNGWANTSLIQSEPFRVHYEGAEVTSTEIWE